MRAMNDFIDSPARRFDRTRRFIAARLSAEGALGLHLTIGLVVVVAAGWWFGDIAEDFSRDALTRALDDGIMLWFMVHATPVRTLFFRAITFFGSVTFLGSASVVLVVVLAVTRSFYRLLAVVLTIGGGAFLNLFLKHLFHRQRPVLENPLVTLSSFGFPSGHTMGATIFYGVLALSLAHSFHRWQQRVGVACAAAVMVALIGISRMYLIAHYFTDVIGALAIGLAWLAFSWTGMVTLRRKKRAQQPAPGRVTVHVSPARQRRFAFLRLGGPGFAKNEPDADQDPSENSQ
jgi:membrane-associated phospholipid phosphatase